MSETVPVLLELQMLQPAFTDIEEIVHWRTSISSDVAEHFTDRLREEIRSLRTRLADEIAESINGRISLVPDHDASIHYARPIYRHMFATSKTRRRDSTGRYNIYFTLSNSSDGKPNTLTIYRVRHAGASSMLPDSSADDV